MGGKRPISQYQNGIFIRSFSCAKEAADILKLRSSTITAVCKKYRGYKTTGGYEFEYIPDQDFDNEIWKYHKCGLKVSDHGRFEFPSGHRTFGSQHGLGYIQISFKKIRYFAHRLVLETFVGPAPTKKECDHKDRNKSNNNLDNLRWVTKRENQNNRNCSK